VRVACVACNRRPIAACATGSKTASLASLARTPGARRWGGTPPVSSNRRCSAPGTSHGVHSWSSGGRTHKMEPVEGSRVCPRGRMADSTELGVKWACPANARRVSSGARRTRRECDPSVLLFVLFRARVHHPRCIPSKSQGCRAPQRWRPLRAGSRSSLTTERRRVPTGYMTTCRHVCKLGFQNRFTGRNT
jgi:hypothetical protein